MTEHPNARLVRDGIDKLNRGDMSVIDLLADDVIWHQIGKPGPVRGKQALAEGLGAAGVGSAIRVTTHDVVANDDHAIALVEATATKGGETLTYRVAEIYHVRDGKIAERWAFSDDTQRITEFFG